jgi:hypothetical protein
LPHGDVVGEFKSHIAEPKRIRAAPPFMAIACVWFEEGPVCSGPMQRAGRATEALLEFDASEKEVLVIEILSPHDS